MFFKELPGFFIFEFYPTNSLPLLSHIPVELGIAKLRDCGIAELGSSVDARVSSSRDVGFGFTRFRICAIPQLRNFS